MDNLSRQKAGGGERSAVASAAYISGTALWNVRENQTSDFRNRQDVVYTTICAPDGAPDWATRRETLWNMVERDARRRDARLAKTITVAITHGIPRERWPELAARYAALFTAKGMIADVGVHAPNGHNPHIHLMLTVRHLQPNGFGGKLKAADQKKLVVEAREGWADLNNEFLAAAGSSTRVDARSYKKRGIAQTPTRHRGPHRTEQQQTLVTAGPMKDAVMTNDEPTKPDRAAAEAAKHPAQNISPTDWLNTARDNADQWNRDHPAEAGAVTRQSSPELATDDYLTLALREPDSPDIAKLRTLVQDQPAAVQGELEAHLLAEKMDRLQAVDRKARLAAMAQQLPAEAQAQLEHIAIITDESRHWPQPVPGPTQELLPPSTLRQAQDRQQAEMEREDEPDR